MNCADWFVLVVGQIALAVHNVKYIELLPCVVEISADGMRYKPFAVKPVRRIFSQIIFVAAVAKNVSADAMIIVGVRSKRTVAAGNFNFAAVVQINAGVSAVQLVEDVNRAVKYALRSWRVEPLNVLVFFKLHVAQPFSEIVRRCSRMSAVLPIKYGTNGPKARVLSFK